MLRRLLLVLACLSSSGCGDDEPAPPTADGAVAGADAPASPADAPAADPDAPVAAADASLADAALADAALADAPLASDAPSAAPDGDPGCGKVGMPCDGDPECGAGLRCIVGGGGGVCAPDRTGCGGFAGALCEEPAAPVCLYLTGTDFGMCLSAQEQMCVCAKSPGAVDGC